MDRRLPIAVGLVLAGVFLVVFPAALWPHYGQAAYALEVEATTSTPPGAATVAHDALPPAAREAVRAAVDGASVRLYPDEHADALGALRAHEYVRYRGTHYRIRLAHGDDPDVVAGLAGNLLVVVGAFAAVLGALTARTGRSRPFTPRLALWLPAGAFVATYLSPGPMTGGAFAIAGGVVLVVPASTSLCVVGSLVRRGRRWRVVRLALLAAAGLAVGAVLTGAPPVVPATVGAYLLAAGAPWFALGYLLTEPRAG